MRTLACCIALACVTAAEAAAPPAPEPDLPRGARRRLGTARWRFGPAHRPCLVPSPDGRLLATIGPGERGADVFDVRSGRRLFRFEAQANEAALCYPLAFAHDGKTLAVLQNKEAPFVSLWPLARGARPRLLHPSPPALNGRIRAAAFLPGDKQLATFDGERLVTWDVAKGRRLREDRLRSGGDLTSFSPDGRLFAARVGDSLVLTDLVRENWWRIALPAAETEDDDFVRWSWSSDGRLMALATSGRRLRIHDARSGRLVRELPRSADLFPATAFSPDGRTLAVEGDYSVQTYDVRSGKLLRESRFGLHPLNGLSNLAYRDERRLLVVDETGFGRTWDVRTGEDVSPGGHRSEVFELAFLADGRSLVSLDQNFRQIRWDVRTGRPVCEEIAFLPTGDLKPSDPSLDHEQALSPDSVEQALAENVNGSSAVRVIHRATGKVRLTLKVGWSEDRAIDAVAFSPDGRRLAATFEECLYVWERATGQGIDRIALPKGFSMMQLVARRDAFLVQGRLGWFSDDRPRPCVVLDPRTAKALLTTAAVTDDCPSVLSADGRTLAVGCEDSSILLYDVPPPPAPKRTRLDEAEQQRLWDDLSAHASHAWRARQRLAAAPKDALALLSKHLKPAPARTIKELADLDAEDFATREAAATKLAAALARGDHGVEAALREMVARPPSLEPYLRARRLLAQAKPIAFTPEELRVIRAVGVVEQIGDGEAKMLLKRLSQGGPSLLTAEARGALARLAKP